MWCALGWYQTKCTPKELNMFLAAGPSCTGDKVTLSLSRCHFWRTKHSHIWETCNSWDMWSAEWYGDIPLPGPTKRQRLRQWQRWRPFGSFRQIQTQITRYLWTLGQTCYISDTDLTTIILQKRSTAFAILVMIPLCSIVQSHNHEPFWWFMITDCW